MVHVAGTNGKGSVIAMLAAIERAAGRSVNAYVSPHLLRFHERILIDGSPIDEDSLVAVLDAAEDANAGAPVTFFEITTAAAFLAFRARPADVTLLETGLGGRLDATNVVERPLLTVITPIGLDHCDRLGPTLSRIAAEKAGIVKAGVPVVVGRQPPEAMRVITGQARRLQAPPYRHGIEWQTRSEPKGWRYEDAAGGRMDLPAGLAGAHQRENAGLATACLHAAPELAAPTVVARRALEQVRWPGRLQRVHRGRLVDLARPGELWVDVGHNPDAARALADWARPGPPLGLVAGLLRTKDAAAFFAAFSGVAERVATVPLGPGAEAWDPGALAAAARQAGLCARPCRELTSAVRWLCRPLRAARILIAGSFVLAGQALLDDAGERRSGGPVSDAGCGAAVRPYAASPPDSSRSSIQS